jgi:hypothetical protein
VSWERTSCRPYLLLKAHFRLEHASSNSELAIAS